MTLSPVWRKTSGVKPGVDKISQNKAVPDSTSAEALALYVPGRLLKESAGEAWRGLRLRVVVQERDCPRFRVPAVVEPFLLRVSSGEALVEERDGPGRPWQGLRVGAGDLFLCSPGAAYEMRIRLLGREPLVTVQALLGLDLLAEAADELYGPGNVGALSDLSGFKDEFLSAALLRLQQELLRWGRPSRLLVEGLARSILVHLLSHYSLDGGPEFESVGLPGHSLRKVVCHLEANLEKAFSLSSCATLARLSPSHFSRLFRASTGLAPSRFFQLLRLERARRLLRETELSVLEVALEVGYGSVSHFSQIFRREAGLSPSAYRRL